MLSRCRFVSHTDTHLHNHDSHESPDPTNLLQALLPQGRMGFGSVYKVLKEVFPQVDARMLKAVAIEHSKDADVAVEFILTDVLPFMSSQSAAPDSPIENPEHSDESQKQGVLLKCEMRVEEANEGSSSKSRAVPAEGTNTISHVQCGILGDSTLLGEDKPSSSLSKFYDASDYYDQMHRNTNSEENDDLPNFEQIYRKDKPAQPPQNSSASLFQEVKDSSSELHPDLELSNGSNNTKCYTVNNEKGHNDLASLDANQSEVQDFLVQQAEFPVKQHFPDSLGCRFEPESNIDQFSHHSSASSGRSPRYNSNADLWHSSGTVTHEFKTDSDGTDHLECLVSNDVALPLANVMVKAAPSHVHEHVLDTSKCGGPSEYYSSIPAAKLEKPKSTVSVVTAQEEGNSAGEEATLNTLVTRSGQVCRIDLLEDSIEDAKSNKKTLFSAVESVIELMQEVEHQEKAAEQAQEEALEGGVTILAKVEEMKQNLQHAKATNDMHAGEVYGEKAILATEARELQVRLLSLSDERDKSLALLNEMRLALEARLAAAEQERQAAEQEKGEKVNSAQKALAEQERIMERVVKESKMLQQEAEENSKLREFLIERGRLVDMLQGEIAVICQDVRLLKEKFDERVPLSESLSSSSSLKSVASGWVAGQAATLETPKNISPASSISGLAPKIGHGDDGDRDDQKGLTPKSSAGDRGSQKALWEEWDIVL